ncbi:unnamed protein product [Rhizophagus irregularis]|nr:unnamed protein product [Rhizophagus irregularis]CAB5375019.1 unnamed protein product [Rhizophagus irregularis]
MCGPVPARDVGIPTGYVPVRISVFMEYEVALPALVLSLKNEITDKAIWMIVKKMRGKELIEEKRLRLSNQLKIPHLRPREMTIPTPRKPTLSEHSIQYLAKYFR